jgi:hypothetical protein
MGRFGKAYPVHPWPQQQLVMRDFRGLQAALSSHGRKWPSFQQMDPPLVRADEMPPAPLVPLSGAFCGHGAAGRRVGLAGPFGAGLQARP